jgi:1-acyl-sn-glycerol-3-phosphate acyltransferase
MTEVGQSKRGEWSFHPAPDLQRSVAERLRDFPREPDMLVYGARSLAAIAVRGWLRTYHRLSIAGRENLPAEGSFVLVSNHASHLDAPCLLASVPLKRVHTTFPAAAADYFFDNLPKTIFSAIFINAMPFDRKAKGEESLAICRELLARSPNALVLFPEGTRSTTGVIGRFRSGIGRIVAGSSIPVVPCHLAGAAAAWPKGGAVPRPRKVHLTIGAPRLYAGVAQTPKGVRHVSDDLRAAVCDLGGVPR